MNLTWHIVQKDFRRMAWPVAGWIAFVATSMVWLATTHMPEDAVRAGEFYRWINGVGGFTWWTIGMQVVTIALLAAHLLQEDATVGSTGFWLTRPIARARMLAAKLIAGGLLFIVAPALALTPVWLASGFSTGEVAIAAGEFVVWQSVILIVAFAVASLTKNLAQFFFAAVIVAVAFALVAYVASFAWRGGEPGIVRSQQTLLVVLPVPFLLVVLGWQSLTRRTRVGWLAIGLGLVALLAIGLAWPWDVTANWPRARSRVRPTTEGFDALAARVAVKKFVTPFDRSLPHAVFVAVDGGPVRDGFFAPEEDHSNLRLADKRQIQFALSPGGLWGQETAKRLAGLARDEGPVEWDMAGRMFGVYDLTAQREVPRVTGWMQFARMRGQVLEEMPLQSGAEARHGSSTIRIVGATPIDAVNGLGVLVEERDALFIRDAGLNSGRDMRRADVSRRDCYLLVNRALGVTKCLTIVDCGSANMASLLVSTRWLRFSAPERIVNGQREELPGWRDGAVLIKVRFELEGRTFGQVSTEHVPVENEEEKK